MLVLQSIFQIRKKSIIAYTDFSTLERKISNKKIESSGTYSNSAKKKFKKILDLWDYTATGMQINFSFITLTISSKMEKNINYSLYLKSFIEKMETRYNKFNYAWKIEFQSNGNLHYHIIIDKEIDWKIVRSQWNKIQSIHVDKYQTKMKEKYRNGFFFDENMLDKNNKIIDEETQKKRYDKGYKANWRNPNSTDVKNSETYGGIANYINKYILKKEEEKEEIETQKKIKRYYGTSDTLKQLKYCTIKENEIDIQTLMILIDNKIKDITTPEGKIICTISEKIQNTEFKILEEKTLLSNRDILYNNKKENNEKLIEKEIKLYNKIFA